MTDDHFQRYRHDRTGQSIDRLIADHWPLVLSICRSYLAQPHDAEDAAQETFVKLMRQADRITGNVSAWLSATARTTSIDAIRRRRVRQHHIRRHALFAVPSREPSQTACYSMMAERLDQALAAIDQWAGELIVQRYIQQVPLRVLGAASGLSTASISRRCSRALDQLREVFEDMGVISPDPAGLRRWLDQIDPPTAWRGGGDGQGLCHGTWSATHAADPPAANRSSGLRPGWVRPIRVGVLMSWDNWRDPDFLGIYAHPEDSMYALGYLRQPGYELLAVIDPATSDIGPVECAMRDYDVMDGLLSWDQAAELSSLDVLIAGHTYNATSAMLERVRQAVRAGVGLYNESYMAHRGGMRDDDAVELCLGEPPFYQYCAAEGHAAPRPVRVVRSHPIISGLNAGDEFDVPGCGLIYRPSPHATVLVAREDPVSPTYASAPGFSPMRMASLLCGEVGRGRVVKVNTRCALGFHDHRLLGGQFISNCIDWLAEPRRDGAAAMGL